MIEFSLQSAEADTYFVRVQVDGAESLLDIDTTPGSPTLNQVKGPTVAIS